MSLHCSVTDLSTWDLRGSASQRTRTPEGFLRAPAMISTADNVQPYRARELGLTDGDPERVIRLFRPKSEVFSKDTLESFERATLTVTHPAKGVNSRDWKRVASGDVHEIRPVGNATSAWLLIRDQAGIDVVEKDGVVQLSCGYDFDLDMTPGKTPSGEAYDGIQRNIRGNHVAIVDAARGGPGLRIADHQHQEKKTMKIRMADRALAGVTLPGFVVTVDDSAGESAQDAMDRHGRACDEAMKAYDAMKSDRDMHKDRAEKAEAKVTGMDVEKKVTDAALEVATKKLAGLPAMVEAAAIERAAVVADAATLVKDFAPAGKAVPAIRLEVLTSILATDEDLKPIVTAALGGSALDKAPAEVITSAFAATAAIAKRIRGTSTDAFGQDADTAARDRALAGGGGDDDGASAGVRKAGKAPRFLGMDAVNEASRLIRLGKAAEADAVLEEARQ